MRIREGNDFNVAWKIFQAGAPVDLSQVTEKKLTFTVYGKKVEYTNYTVSGQTLMIEFPKEVTTVKGDYRLIFEYTIPDSGQSDGDLKRTTDVVAFRIVPFTADADTDMTVNVSSDVAIAFKGDKGDRGYDAYHTWLDVGNTGTYEDYIAWLRQPAVDAGASIAELEATIEGNESDRVVAENERDEAEELRVQAETLRSNAESGRVTAEGLRDDAEALRISAETSRASNETQRTTKETARETAEGGRIQAENERETAETTRVSNENNRVTAEQARVNAEIVREQQEQARQANTATAITNAENAIADVNAAKDDYYNVVKPDIIAQGEYATAQGDYAKAQGEAVDGRISVIEDKVDKNIGWYGIEFDETIANSACKRIGSMDLHIQLPIQNRMKRCLLLDNGTVNYYLHRDDSTKKADGTDAVLDGTDGQVMVEIPAHWRRFEKDGTVHRVKISDYNVSGFHFVPKSYRSAYEATVERGPNKLASVVNTTPEFRGGNNDSAWDGTYRSLLGVPATAISLTNFRNYARNRGAAGQFGAGWNCDLYELQKTTFWLYAIEYANFNVQLPFNAALTAQGYRQGGLGDGVTTLASAAWSAYNSYNPFIPCGYTNSLGNNSGIVPFAMPAEYGTALTVNVPSYRGIENPFGHIWHWTDGLRVRYTTAEEGNLGELYVQLDPTKYNSENLADYAKRGTLPPSEGYIREMIVGEFGENMPSRVGGASTTYFADYHYQPTRPPETELIRGVRFGGDAYYGANAGLSFSNTNNAVSLTYATIGSRLCFLP